MRLRVYLDELDRKHGGYVLLYGGDPYVPERPDVAALLHYAGADGAHVVAVQCDEYAEYMRKKSSTITYNFVAAACFYPTQKDDSKRILYGGFRPDTRSGLTPELVGATKIYFDSELVEPVV